MKITLKQIIGMKPCEDRLGNFIRAYPNFVSSELEAFLELREISTWDKIWVLVRLMTKTQKIHFATACANSTLHIFESHYPDEKRPREVLDFLSKFEDPANLSEEDSAQLVRLHVSAPAATHTYAPYDAYAAYAATYAAYTIAYTADAAYAAHAAANAANNAANAAEAAVYIPHVTGAPANITAYAANIAAFATGIPADNKLSQEDLNLIFAHDILVNSRS